MKRMHKAVVLPDLPVALSDTAGIWNNQAISLTIRFAQEILLFRLSLLR